MRRAFTQSIVRMRVWDVEKGSLQPVNLQAVLAIRALGMREPPDALVQDQEVFCSIGGSRSHP